MAHEVPNLAMYYIFERKKRRSVSHTKFFFATYLYGTIFIPNRTFLVRFGGISGEFGRAMVRILARLRLAKIPTVRLNELDMLPKRTKKGAIRNLPYPNSS